MSQQVQQESLRLRGTLFDGDERTDVGSLAELMDELQTSPAFGYLEIEDPDRLQLAELADRLGAPDLIHPPVSASAGHMPMVAGEHVRLSTHRVQLEEPTFQLVVADLHIYVLPRLLILDHDGDFDFEPLRARLATEKRHRDQGVGWLLWIVLDQLLGEAGAALNALDDELDDIEDILLAPGAKPAVIQNRVYQLRKSASRLRRCLLPLRDAVDALLRREADCVSPGLFPLFQGLYDRGVHHVEWADSLRDLVTALSDTQIAMEGNRLNVIMKKVTSWAAIIAVPAAVTGFYGQNLPYPGFNTMGGLWMSTLLMVVGCGGLYLTFKRKDWL
ncbi:CorA family divalent cation transporter [Leifsonia sp. EB34]|uniref:CorA family divalent cation transporter n=1 Tax=Leifsonia sp. EB34 TaxID=3156303 RepID=UPI0035136C6A